ncbi:MAG: hypothetical protein HYV45_03505 [Candidatus Moranbacteria bacterium]|nr:hypothetical protein [Candidatus Moranbacteria bacterium]
MEHDVVVVGIGPMGATMVTWLTRIVPAERIVVVDAFDQKKSGKEHLERILPGLTQNGGVIYLQEMGDHIENTHKKEVYAPVSECGIAIIVSPCDEDAPISWERTGEQIRLLIRQSIDTHIVLRQHTEKRMLEVTMLVEAFLILSLESP